MHFNIKCKNIFFTQLELQESKQKDSSSHLEETAKLRRQVDEQRKQLEEMRRTSEQRAKQMDERQKALDDMESKVSTFFFQR